MMRVLQAVSATAGVERDLSWKLSFQLALVPTVASRLQVSRQLTLVGDVVHATPESNRWGAKMAQARTVYGTAIGGWVLGSFRHLTYN